MVNLREQIVEGNGGEIYIRCYDGRGKPLLPDEASWRLSDSSGTVINSRSSVALTPAYSMVVKLDAEDTTIAGNDAVRLLYVKGTYTDTEAVTRPIVEEFQFTIERTTNRP